MNSKKVKTPQPLVPYIPVTVWNIKGETQGSAPAVQVIKVTK
jgi:hypothetical protein